MDTLKSSALLLICTLIFISSVTPILGCGYCGDPAHRPNPRPIPGKGGHSHPIKPTNPPITLPTPIPPTLPAPPVLPVPLPPVTPVLPVPPVTPVIPLPPVPVLNPPTTPSPSGKPCPTGPKDSCPIDALKLGACVDVLGLIHIGLGDPSNQCCPLLNGLVEIEAAACLCTTLKLKLLNLNLYVPLALQLLLTCGKTPPPGFTCAL